MSYTRKLLMTILTAALILPVLAWAAPQVKLNMTAEKDVVIVEEGKQITKRLPVETAAPGEVVIYTVTFTNTGDEAATNVVVNNPIPEGTAYLAGSAGDEAIFSIDGGQSYDTPARLTREVVNPDGSKGKITATPDDYTHIRWQIPAIPAGGSGKVLYQVKVK